MKSKYLTIVLLGLALCCFLQIASAQGEKSSMRCLQEQQEEEFGQAEEEEEAEEWDEDEWQEEIGRIEEEEEEELPEDEELEGYPGEFNRVNFQEMNEHDGSTLPYSLVELRQTATQPAIDLLISYGLFSQGQYITSRVYATEVPIGLYRNTHKFNVHVRDANGVDYRIWFIVTVFFHGGYQLVDAGYVEMRGGEFPELNWEVEESAPSEVSALGTKAVNQAIGRLTAKNIILPGSYSFSKTSSVEFSAIVNNKEYTDHEDGLYRFNATLSDAAGLFWKVWVVIATNYETPENYELIDFGYYENSLSDFSNVKFINVNEDNIKTKAVMEAVKRMVTKGIIPDGNTFTLTNTYSTEIAPGFQSPLYSNDDFVLTNFTVQVTNTYQKPYKIYVIVITDDDEATTDYALVDYGLIKSD